MARILYGVSGEGSGHSSRAREVASWLIEDGHQVKMVSYDRGYRNLADDFDVFETEGLHIASVDNRVSMVKTITDNISRLSKGAAKLRELRHVGFKDYRPHVVLTDFEPMTAYLARHYELPLVSIDNQHRLRHMRHPCPEHLKNDARTTRAVIKLMVPEPDVYLVTTFWFGEVSNERTFLFPPILRRSVQALQPRDDGHLLVYFTSGFEPFIEQLAQFDNERFLVYGAGREGSDGPLTFKAPSRDGFLDDLAGAKAVISTAGFTLMTEAMALGKPMLALPMAGQFEQELNAVLLEELGLGKNGRAATADSVGAFLYELPRLRERLAEAKPDDGSALRAALNELLADDGAGARACRARRLAANSGD